MSQADQYHNLLKAACIAYILLGSIALYSKAPTDMVDLKSYKGYPQMVKTVYEAWTKEGKSIPPIVKNSYDKLKKGNTKVTFEELLQLNGALGPYAGSYKATKKNA